jgi:hypothetical protein
VGLAPVGVVVARVFDAVLMTPTEAEFPLVTKTFEPSGVEVTQFGNEKPATVVSRLPFIS